MTCAFARDSWTINYIWRLSVIKTAQQKLNQVKGSKVDSQGILCLNTLSLLSQVIAAEGEHKASYALKEAADVINQSPSALQLRYLQTLNCIAAEKNSTIIFPMPVELLNAFVRD
jgi:hypothetical protein